MSILHDHTPPCEPPAAQDLGPFSVHIPKGDPARAAWWTQWKAATRDPRLAEGIFDTDAGPPPLSPSDEAGEQWRELTLAERRLLGDQPYHLPEPSRDLLAGLAVVLLHPRSQEMVVDLLMDALAAEIAKLVAIVTAKQGEVVAP